MFNWFKKYQLFTKEECDKIIIDVENNKDNLKVSNEHGTIKISSYEINTNELSKDTYEMINNKVSQIVNYKIVQCFIIKYSPDTIPDMPAHYDMTKYSLVANLNNDFEGGGTYFDDGLTTYLEQGDILIHSSRIKHAGLPITKGTRYLLVGFLNIDFKVEDKLNNN
jgi:hypothetical protein